ncbi:MAG: hypothetical protein ACO2YO_05485 [Paracoccaceae bacterium]|nr:hypothetical protein [Pseudomonadota bacterium]MDA0850785.1 hypothetical protein [Pseudomonadota bacterium]MDA1296067.1 hypothetical protein [Pseudomonadota bacterium]
MNKLKIAVVALFGAVLLSACTDAPAPVDTMVPAEPVSSGKL